MTNDTLALRLLSAYLDGRPTAAPAGLLATIMAAVDQAPQHRPRVGTGQPFGGVLPVARSRTLWLAATVALLVLALGASALLPGLPWSIPSPIPTATPQPTSSNNPSGPPASMAVIDDLPAYSELVTPATVEGPYRSVINPWVTFDLYCAGVACRDPFVGELCGPRLAPGLIELLHAKACRDSISVIRPDSVDCRNTADIHPDADKLAQVLLATETLHAVDLGTIGSAQGVPADLFAQPYEGRVIQILGGPTGTGRDRVGCTLLLDPALGRAPIEVRGDTETTLVLVEVGSSLFLVRAFAQAFTGGSPNLFLQGHLLNLIHHIRFVP